MGLKEFVLEKVGDEEVASEVVKGLHEYMIDKEQYKKKVTELNSLQEKFSLTEKELEDLRVAQMDEQQKMQFELEKAKNKEKEFTLKSNRFEAVNILTSAGLKEEDYKEIIEGLVSEDLEKTKTLASGVVGVLNRTKESAINQTKEELLNGTPSPQGGNSEKPPAKTSENKRFI